jgi:hypothetical protein
VGITLQSYIFHIPTCCLSYKLNMPLKLMYNITSQINEACLGYLFFLILFHSFRLGNMTNGNDMDFEVWRITIQYEIFPKETL